MKKKSTLILLSGLLLGLVSCGSNASSTPVPSTPNPTTPVQTTPAPTTPTPTTPTPTTPTPTTPTPTTPTPTTPTPTTPTPTTPVVTTPTPTTPTPTTPTPTTPTPTTPTPTPVPDIYYNPSSSYYKIPKDVVAMHTAYTTAAGGDATGFVAKLVGLQSYNGNTANAWFANGSYGFRVNNLALSATVEVGNVYLVTGPKDSKAYDTINANVTTSNVGIQEFEVSSEPITATNIDLGSYEDTDETSIGCAVTFVEATVTEILTGRYPGIRVSYKDKTFDLTYPSGVNNATDLGNKIAELVVGQKVSGQAIRSGAAQYTLCDASDITPVAIEKTDLYLTASHGSNDYQDADLAFNAGSTTVTIGADGKELRVFEPLTSSETVYKVAVEFALPTVLTSWTGVQIAIDSGEATDIASTEDINAAKLEYVFEFSTDVRSHTVSIQYNNPFYNDYQTEIRLAEGMGFESASNYDALHGTLSVVEGVTSSFLDGRGLLLIGSEEPTDDNEIDYYPASDTIPTAGNYIGITLTAPEGFVPDETNMVIRVDDNEILNKAGNEIEWTTKPTQEDPSIPYTYTYWFEVRESMIPSRPTSTRVASIIDVTWKANTKAENLSVTMRGTVTLAPNPNANDVDLATLSFPQQSATIAFATEEKHNEVDITATGVVPYYQEDLNVGRAEGNRVGVLFQAPEAFRNGEAAPKITIWRNGAIHNGIEEQDLTYDYTDYRFEWYPLVTSDMLPEAGQTKLISTVEIKWSENATIQKYNIILGAGTTLQADPMAALQGTIASFGNNGIQNSIDGAKVTFTATEGKAEIPYYEADESIGRTAGNRLGVNIKAPELEDYSAAKITITKNGAPIEGVNDAAIVYDDETNHSFEWWPSIDQATLEYAAANEGLISTVSVVWKEGTKAQVFEIVLSGTFTLQSAPATSKQYVLNLADFTNGTQYAEEEAHVLNEDLTIISNDAHFRSDQIRMYSSKATTGYVDLVSKNGLSSVILSMGYGINTVTVQASADGENWTKIKDIETVKDYKEYDVDLTSGSYKIMRLTIAASGAQVRINGMTINYLG